MNTEIQNEWRRQAVRQAASILLCPSWWRKQSKKTDRLQGSWQRHSCFHSVTSVLFSLNGAKISRVTWRLALVGSGCYRPAMTCKSFFFFCFCTCGRALCWCCFVFCCSGIRAGTLPPPEDGRFRIPEWKCLLAVFCQRLDLNRQELLWRIEGLKKEEKTESVEEKWLESPLETDTNCILLWHPDVWEEWGNATKRGKAQFELKNTGDGLSEGFITLPDWRYTYYK